MEEPTKQQTHSATLPRGGPTAAVCTPKYTSTKPCGWDTERHREKERNRDAETEKQRDRQRDRGTETAPRPTLFATEHDFIWYGIHPLASCGSAVLAVQKLNLSWLTHDRKQSGIFWMWHHMPVGPILSGR